MEWQAMERTIWMDGRPHPSEYAQPTWQGFSTEDPVCIWWSGLDPGKNRILDSPTTLFKMPPIAARGGPETMCPKLRKMRNAPARAKYV
jgi:hypothetical protein